MPIRTKVIQVIRRADPTRHICNNLVGKEHPFAHRATVGILIMIAGVLVAHIVVEAEMLKLMLDTIGYAMHGAGLTPFVELIVQAGGEE